jgi:hypothetical protein
MRKKPQELVEQNENTIQVLGGSIYICWLKKKIRLFTETTKFSTECPFLAVSAQQKQTV